VVEEAAHDRGRQAEVLTDLRRLAQALVRGDDRRALL